MAKLSNRLSNLTPEQLELLRKKLEDKPSTVKRDRIEPRKNREEHPLSSAQKRLWFLQQLEPESAFYNLPSAIRLKGKLDVSILEKSINAIIERHEVLRARFTSSEQGEPIQEINKDLHVPLIVKDLRRLPANKKDGVVQKLLRDEAGTPFNLSDGPLLRTLLIRMEDEEYVLCINMHHIIADGWSVGVFIQEFSALYRAFGRNEENPLPPLNIQYADYARWQLERQSRAAISRQLDYWKDYLRDMPQILHLPLDRKRPPLPSYRGRQHIVTLDKDITAALRLLAKEMKVSLYALIMAAFQVFLYKISGQTDFGVGAPIANRNRAEVEPLIGFFVNTIVLRANLSDDPPFRQLVKRVSEDIINASDNQDIPFEQIVEALVPEHNLSHSPLFQVMFDLQKAPLDAFRLDELRVEIVDIEIEIAKFDLMLLMTEERDQLRCLLEYSTDLFESETVKRFTAYFKTLLAQITAYPERVVSSFSILSEREKQKLLVSWNNTASEYPSGQCVHQLFEEQVKIAPDNIALLTTNAQVTYAELNQKANRLAHYLIHHGLQPDQLVALFLERSIEAIVAVLACLKAGAAYLPLDPEYPAERIRFMLEDTSVSLILTQTSLQKRLPDVDETVFCLDEDWPKLEDEPTDNPVNRTIPDNLIYVMYTSGSTGKPKGVSIVHRAVVRLVKNTNYASFGSDETFLHMAPASFDASTLEIWGALLNGAKLYILPSGVPSFKQLADTLSEQKISFAWFTAGLFHLMVDAYPQEMAAVRQLLAGGDVLSVPHVNKLLAISQNQTLVNGYGPTENTTFTCCHPMHAEEHYQESIPFGSPIANTRVYILDKHFQPVPVGVTGELFIGGDGLARGYFNRPDLTAEKFIPNPFSKGERLYRSGDLVRWLPDGKIQFIGRMDNQVKIRGFRIELGEVENALLHHSEIKDAVTLVQTDKKGDKVLTAFLLVGDAQQQLSADQLRSYLKNRLPDYMIPNDFIFLPEFPLTPNGKVDRKALQQHAVQKKISEDHYVPPRNDLERFLAEIWQDVLGIEKVGIHDNFFELGGNSLKAAVLTNRLQKELDEVVHVGAVFKAPRISELAMYIVEYIPEFIEKRFGITAESLSGVAIKVDEKGEVKKIGQREIDQFDNIISHLAFAPARNAKLPKNKRAVFLLSPPRSGSTLLRVMLAGNPRLFSPPELDLLSFNTLRERRRAFSAKGLEIWLEATIRAVMGTKDCSAEEATKIMNELEKRDLTTREFYGLLQKWIGDGRMIVDKTPTYGFDPNILKRAEEDFEDPLYIHLIRHPYAMIYSFIEAKLDQNFFRYEHPFTRRELAELIWIITNRNINDFLCTIPAERQYRIRFEDLLIDSKTELLRLCEFLNIPFDNEMLKPYEGKKMTDGITSGSQMVGDFKFYLHRNINSRVADKWRSYHSTDFLSDIAWQYAEQFDYPVEKDPAKKSAGSRRISLTKIEPVPRDSNLELSFAQQRLWFLEQMEPGNVQYNIPGAIRMKGRLHIPILEANLNTIIERHESLRTIFSNKDGKASQIILPKLKLNLEQIDLRSLPEEKRETEALRLANAEACQPFNLVTGPLIRALLIRLRDDDYIFIVITHHIISDGWSVNLFVQELSVLYQAGCRGQQAKLPSLPIQYADFAAWQRRWLSGGYLKNELDFWKKELTGLSPYLDLPTDYPRPPVISYEGRRKAHHIKIDLIEALSNLRHKQETTLFTILLTAFEILLYRYSGQDNFAVGTPVANRTRVELEPLIGLFVNTLVLRANLSENPSFEELLRRNKQITMETFDHQQIPFEKIVDVLQPERDMSHTPLFQVMFSLQSTNIQTLKLDVLTIHPFNLETQTAKFDLSLEIVEDKSQLVAIFEYKTKLFKASTIERMIGHFETLLESIVAQPQARLSDLLMLGASEEQTLLKKWNQETIPFPNDTCIHTLFEQQAVKTPQAEAVNYLGHSISYRRLNAQANQLAHHLLKLGVKKENVVAVLMERSSQMIIAIMGILKAGGAYLPLDPSYPDERLNYMLEDAGVNIICTQKTLLPLVENKGLIPVCLDDASSPLEQESTENPGLELSPLNLAYLIYTSGSTGRPKGVMLQHRSALNLAENLHHTVYKRLGSNTQRISLNAPIPFDASVQQIVMLTRGHALYIIPQEARTDGVALLNFLRKNKIDVLDCVPSQLKILLSAGLLDEGENVPKAILPGGEAIDESTWQTLVSAPATEFYNMYGPTECTVDSTIFRIKDYAEKPTIGRPIANVRFYVLDPFQQPVPIGTPGELYIAGAGLARGYLNRPDLTAEKFLPDPFSGERGARMYASGDLVRWLEEGVLEFLGRVDHQVKVRGFRMELGEIEAVLREHDAVDDAVVAAHSDDGGEKRLVAYLTGQQDKIPGIRTLRSFLSEKLPDYMIPATFVHLESFPLLPNGKVNRKALPRPEFSRSGLESEYVEPVSENEIILAEIWKQVLGIEKVGIRDNFFELGGDSILSIQVIARARQHGLQITPKQLFENPTIESLASLAGSAPVIHAEQGPVSGPLTLTPIQRHFFEQNHKNPHHWNQSILLEVRENLDPQILKQVVEAIVRHHDALRLRFKRENGRWMAFHTDTIDQDIFSFMDFSQLPNDEQPAAIEAEANRLQTSLNLQNGPLLRVTYFKRGAGMPDRLLLIIHHLAVDGISWRILTEDIRLAYSQAISGKKIILPPKTTSFQYWAQRLVEYAKSDTLKEEKDFWLQIQKTDIQPLPIDFSEGANTEESARKVVVLLNKEKTSALLQEVPSVYNTQINDALLTALLNAYNRWTGQNQIFLQLEGHGREEIADDMDVSRTVGWFTTMYPLLLTKNHSTDIGQLLKSVKEQLRRIPQKGIGYGLLFYIINNNKIGKTKKPAIVFNYLGQFDQLVNENSIFRVVQDYEIKERAAENHREFLLDISASVKNSRLVIQIIYSKNRHKRKTIESFASYFKENLLNLVEFCRSTEAGGYTPSDFSDVTLEEEEIDDLLSELD